MRKPLLGLGMLALSVGCAATEAPDPGPSPAATPQVLEHAPGRWIARPIEAAALTAQCPRCSLAITHDVSDVYGTFVDATTVCVARSTVEGIADGSVLCTATWAYSASANQAYGDAGQLVDYELLADTCGIGSTGIIYEDHALWAGGVDVIEVIESPSPPGAPAQDVTTWLRCISGSASIPFCPPVAAVTAGTL